MCLGLAVAGQTFRVVVRSYPIGGLMGVVACDAADPRVISDETLSQFKPVRLTPDRSVAVRAIADHVVECAVALAEIRESRGALVIWELF